MNPSFLITGGHGFVGSALMAALSSRYRAIAVSRDCNSGASNYLALSQVLGGYDGEAFVRDFAPSQLIHCAALAHRSPPRTARQLKVVEEVNINLAVRFARLAKRMGVKRFVFISSIGVHGSSATSAYPIDEETPICPANPYALSKSIAEHRLRECLDGSSCELSIVRPALVYGQGMPGNFRSLIRAIDSGCPFPLGRIRNQRSFLSLENLISAIEVVSLHPQAAGESFVVADQETISTPELIDTIARLRNKPCRLLPVPATLMHSAAHLPHIGRRIRQLVDDLVVDSTKIRQQLGWQQPLAQAQAMAAAFALSTSSPT